MHNQIKAELIRKTADYIKCESQKGTFAVIFLKHNQSGHCTSDIVKAEVNPVLSTVGETGAAVLCVEFHRKTGGR